MIEVRGHSSTFEDDRLSDLCQERSFGGDRLTHVLQIRDLVNQVKGPYVQWREQTCHRKFVLGRTILCCQSLDVK